jgi:hypothetical protein
MADPRPSSAQTAAQVSRAERCRDDTGAQREDGELGLEADAQVEPESHPHAGRVALQQPEHEVHRDEPGELVEGDRLKEPVGAEQQRAHHGDERGQRLGAVATTHLTRAQAGEDDEQRADDGGNDPQGGRGRAEQRRVQPGQQRRDRRVVDVAQRGMLTAGDVIQLVAVETVVAVGGQVNGELHRAQREQWCCRATPPMRQRGAFHRRRILACCRRGHRASNAAAAIRENIAA